MSKRSSASIIVNENDQALTCWFDGVVPLEIVNEIASYFMPLEVLMVSFTSHRQYTQMSHFKKREIRIGFLARCHACSWTQVSHVCMNFPQYNSCYPDKTGVVLELKPKILARITSFKLRSLHYDAESVVFRLTQRVAPVWVILRGSEREHTFSFSVKDSTTIFTNPLKHALERATVFEKVLLYWADQTHDDLHRLLFVK